MTSPGAPRWYILSAMGVDAECWNDLARDIRKWRVDLRDRSDIPTGRELHACALVLNAGYEIREDSERTKDIPIKMVIGGLPFRNSVSDDLLDLIAHVLLKQGRSRHPEPAPYSISLGQARLASVTPSTSCWAIRAGGTPK